MHALTFCQRALQAVTSQSLAGWAFRPGPLFLEYPFPRADNFDGANLRENSTPLTLRARGYSCAFLSSLSSFTKGICAPGVLGFALRFDPCRSRCGVCVSRLVLSNKQLNAQQSYRDLGTFSLTRPSFDVVVVGSRQSTAISGCATSVPVSVCGLSPAFSRR